MAILIPSTNTYGKKNPKVVDNVIERIEVNSVEVIPDNNYKIAVYNNDFDISSLKNYTNFISTYKDTLALNQGGETTRYVRGACGLKYSLTYLKIPEVLIPKVSGNKFISKIYDGYDTLGAPEIQIGVKVKNKVFLGFSSYNPYKNEFDFENANLKQSGEEKILYDYSSIGYENDISSSVSSLTTSTASSINSTHSIKIESNTVKVSSYLFAQNSSNWSPESILVDCNVQKALKTNEISVTETTIDGVEYYKLSSVEVFCGVEATFGSCLIENKNPLTNLNAYATATTTKVVNECEGVSITVYGNTIGIDLNDKTILINGNASKNVYSINGNELMQTSNYYKLQSINSIVDMFENTQAKYAKGKETATIRCSISDYYQSVKENVEKEEYFDYPLLDGRFALINKPPTSSPYAPPSYLLFKPNYEIVDVISVSGVGLSGDTQISYIKDGNSIKFYVGQEGGDIIDLDISMTVAVERKEKVVSIDNSTGKMCFDIYDEVIPMVYGADGKDYPMSRYADGSPKVFKVLGMRPFYDGAVWQELSLQEK